MTELPESAIRCAMTKDKTRDRIQFGAIPITFNPDGKQQVMLMTSRGTQRWVIPKGWPIHGLKPREVAAREAFEEAGLLGQIVGKKPIGFYPYNKQLASGEDVLCSVDVFLFRVDGQADTWPEKGQRELCWVDPVQAADMVLEGSLAEILRHFVPGIFQRQIKR